MLFSLLLLACPEPPEPSGQRTSQDNNQNAQPNDGNPPPNDGKQQKINGNPPSNFDQNGGEKNLNTDEEKMKLNPEMRGGYPENTGEIITQSILIRINESGKGDPEIDMTQEKLQGKDHVTISGSIICEGDGCDHPMIMRIIPFVENKPGEPPPEGILVGSITSKSFSEIGQYSILVPKSKNPVVIELLVDQDEDTYSTPGERMAVLDRGGQIVPFSNLSDMNLDVTNRKIEGPMGGPLSPDEPPPPEQEE